MARLVTYQTSFADGQISPKLEGFVDTDAYRSSVKDLKNMVVMPQGSITRRPGTRYVASTKSNAQVRLIPFNFGQDQAYVLEFGNQYVRFFKNNAVLESGGSAYEITSPYSTADLDNLSFTQSADILFIAHPSYQPRQLIRSGDTNWEFDFIYTKDGPYGDINPVESATMQVVGTEESEEIGSPQVDVSDHFFQLANHELLDGMRVRISCSGTFPTYHLTSTSDTPTTNFANNVDYFVVNATATTFQLSTTLKGRPVYIRAFTETITISKRIYPKGDAISLQIGDGTSSLWSNSGSKTKNSIVTYTATSGAVTPSDGSPDLLFTDTNHGLVNDDRIQFRHASGALPGGIAESTNYYVKKINDNTFNISLTPSTGANTTINYSSSAGSNVSWYKNPLFYTCVATHTASAQNYPGSVLGNDYWELLNVNNGRGIEHYDVDTYFRFNPLQGTAINWGYVQIDSITNALEVTATVKQDLVARGPNHEWRKYAWNSNAGWPRTIEIFQQRMCFGGNNDNPQTIWFSKTADFFNFAPSERIGVASGNVSATGARVVGEQIKDDNGLTLTISSATVDLIDFMVSGKKLTVGTSGGVFQMYGSETEITITPFNFSIDRVTSYPTETGALPLIIDQNVIYVQKNGRKLRDISYSSDRGGNQASDMTLRADDIALGVVKDIAYQDMPYNVIWARLNDGKMIACTYNKALNMMAWSNHEIAGTNAVVESITVIPTTTHHQLWMVVKRTVNSATVRYVEYLDRFYDSGEITSDEAHYVDSGIYTTGSGVTNLTGLNHLEGESLRVLADSALQIGTFTVSSGAITISEADKIHAGLGFDSFVTTLDIPNGPQGILVGNRKKISRIVVKLLDTMGLKYGPNTSELDEMIYRFPTDNLGNAVPFFSGDEVLTMGNMTYDDHNVVIGQDGPFPLSILLIGFDYESNDL